MVVKEEAPNSDTYFFSKGGQLRIEHQYEH